MKKRKDIVVQEYSTLCISNCFLETEKTMVKVYLFANSFTIFFILLKLLSRFSMTNKNINIAEGNRSSL